jgi:multidrug efflux system membrane fusion protein
MKRYFIIMLMAAGCFVFSCKNGVQKDTAPEIIKVKTAKVEKKAVSIPIRCSGLLASEKEMKLSFKTGGIIEDIFVDEGMGVNSGKLLARLDLSEIEAQVEQAVQGLEKAKRDFQRVQNLYKDSVATLENLQNAETALNIAKSNFQIASFNKDHSEIYAPSNGTILKRMAEENEIVGAGQPVFIFASTEGNWIIRSGITDKDIVKLSLGDSARVNFDAYPQQSFQAAVTEIGEFADPYTGTYEVEFSLEPCTQKLVNGFVAKLDIFPSVKNDFMLLPISALREANGYRGFVYVMKDGKHHKQRVKLGPIVDGKVIVVSGINDGEDVITEGSAYLNNDSKIELVQK